MLIKGSGIVVALLLFVAMPMYVGLRIRLHPAWELPRATSQRSTCGLCDLCSQEGKPVPSPPRPSPCPPLRHRPR